MTRFTNFIVMSFAMLDRDDVMSSAGIERLFFEYSLIINLLIEYLISIFYGIGTHTVAVIKGQES